MAENCIFCSILAGDMPGEVVDEDEHTVAYMDIAPWTRGHAVVVPRRHVANLYEIEDDELARVSAAGRRLALKMRDKLGADGVNLLNSTGSAAWQTVFHFHLHVIPRYEGDPLELPTQPAKVDPEEMARVAAEIRG
ncbi:MAG: HIT family protein [Thermoleophilaceae bacterium]